ncbi:hypothetical protein [Escherichia phage vB_EcoM_JNE01]|nr:hypothetical protein [Escherichia phage vB_EcoM_JNE01]
MSWGILCQYLIILSILFFYYSVLKTIFKKYLQTMFKGV